MKKTAIACILATAILCAEETHLQLPTIDETETTPKVVILETPKDEAHNFNRRFIPYVKLGPDLLNVGLTPNLGLGIRSESNNDAVDLSISYSSKVLQGAEGEEKREYQIFFPKLQYQRFLNPTSPSTFFYGAGGSWGAMKSETADKEFAGLYGDFCVGYEKGRDSFIRQIVQCNLTQPLLSYYQKGSLPTPTLEVTYSLGF